MEGTLALAEVIELGLFPRLRQLSLAHNSIDETSGQRLREACGRQCLVLY